MAIYHYSAQVISRSHGRSSVAAAAYRAGERYRDERTGLIHDYTKKTGVAFSRIYLPEGAPEWMKDREQLWNHVEEVERRKDAQLSREVNLALPIELTESQQVELLEKFVNDVFVSAGMVADVNLHLDNPENPHAHIMLSMREVTLEGFGKKVRDWNDRAVLRGHRVAWADYANDALGRAGHLVRIDHRTLHEQGIDREATIHLGPNVKEMEQKAQLNNDASLKTERAQWNREVYSNPRARAQFLEQAYLRVQRKLIQRYSTFTDSNVRYELIKATAGFVDLTDTEMRSLVNRQLKEPNVVTLGMSQAKRLHYSTREVLAQEANLLELAKSRHQDARFHVADKHRSSVLLRYMLSDEQRNALNHLITTDGLGIVNGLAGTGKTYMLRAARETWEAGGYRVMGAAFTGKAALSLEGGAGIASTSIHKLLFDLERGKLMLTDRTVLVVDEASLISTELFNRLISKTDAARSKLVITGDVHQLSAIDAGGGMRMLTQHYPHATMGDIRRQASESERALVSALSKGEARSVLKAYQEKGRLHVYEQDDSTKHALIRQWHRGQQDQPDRSHIILAQQRKHVTELNQLARTSLQETGELGEDMSLATTEGRKMFAKGERLMFTRNDYELDVKNGQLGTLIDLQPTVHGMALSVMKDDDRKVVRFHLNDYQDITHGYAMTAYKSQGITVDHGYWYAEGRQNRELSYVALSRHRQDSHVFVTAHNGDAKQAIELLAHSMHQSEQKRTAHDYVSEVMLKQQRQHLHLAKNKDRER